MKNKILASLGFCTLLSTVSCADYSKTSLIHNIIKNDDEVLEVGKNNDKTRTDTIFKTLLNYLFKNDKVAELNYIQQQTQNTQEIEQEFLDIATKYQDLKANNSKDDIERLQNEKGALSKQLEKYKFEAGRYRKEIADLQNKIIEINKKIAVFYEESNAFAKQQSEVFSKNWYFFLKNIDKFDFTFVEYVFDGLQNGKVVDAEYKEIIDNKLPSNDFRFYDNYLDAIKPGDENVELGDAAVFYLKKDKLVFRILIDKLSETPELKMSAINWYFPESKARTISLSLITSVVHTLFLHQYEIGRIAFKENMVQKQKYGSPVFVFGLFNEQRKEV
ncbi:aromatic motif membrane protein [Mycoplasma leonicaptivi]|uniref:aromatic motif membrane protein n=1 Tax=Mycoplasma leonicaptivi TaxID=36742 RepID=UPI00048099D1|nr:aromatic motif membrane protein [Mycoplasma leonicaptivi]